MSSRQALALPSGFISMRDVLDGSKPPGSFVNVIGLVSDFRAPTPTRGADWKCQLSLFDLSIQYDNEEFLDLHFFCPKDKMPELDCGDVLLVSQAKVQHRLGSLSLITNSTTDIQYYSAEKIPRPPADAAKALVSTFRNSGRRPSKAECLHVSSLWHEIDKSRLPTKMEFEQMTVLSTNVKDKFRLLKDVTDSKFCDLVVQVVRDPFDRGDHITVWVSDYTENPLFFHYVYDGNGSKFDKSEPRGSTWAGPFGKRSLQLTCWEPHASAIRDRGIASGSWLHLRNVHVKFGRNGSNLEGFLREDRGAHGVKIGVSLWDPTRDTENNDPRLVEAIRRKRDYEREKRQHLKSITEAAEAGQKRKSDLAADTKPTNAKARRKAQRARAAKEAEDKAKENGQEEEGQKESIPVSDLNPLVKCENQHQPASSVAQILETAHHGMTVNDQTIRLPLPFVNMNHRANVRVVDFQPSNLEDFACAKKNSEYDGLSDNNDSDLGSGSEEDVMVGSSPVRQWEWRFYLALEDAAVADSQQKQTVWVVVDNQAAQCLMNLDATDLGRDRESLDALRQKLFYLWGNLEEHKSRQAARTNRAQGGPPPDSSDEEGRAREDRQPEQVANRPFACCIRQYGAKVPERDPGKADAGDGKRWQRMYGLFGARISGA